MTAQFQFGLVVRGQAERGEDIYSRFEETLEFVRLADRLGYDSVTKTAHYSAYPFQMLQLVPMLARFAGEAPRLRLNAGVLLLPLMSPLHVAEEFATLDVISHGKIILGVGLGYRDVEFKAFGVPRSQRARRFEANLVAVKRLWTEEKVSMKTPYFELDEASCLPKPLQQPHPPIWVGANADPAVERAARLGDCWYIGPAVEIATVERQMELYRRALDAAGKPFPTELPMRREVFVAKTREEASRLCAPYLGAKYEAYHAWRQELPTDDRGLGQTFESLVGDRFLIGSPDEVAEQMLAIHRRLGVNHLVMSTEWAGMPKSLAIETMEMIASELIPRVRQGL
ncbi:MAG TPA: LLM class flavin-dependent oxidoreductase [Acetobacteraceae bacterium]|jgi:alkanesulfonate monooxygenase SsuD/methylene tetrahydromethanopterin reductase-like flavin-dependent oxidoreductase (luciferase family)|nr:LLM class flavin-dependent oxidoreductase [Acetobacteraceae bacterium]